MGKSTDVGLINNKVRIFWHKNISYCPNMADDDQTSTFVRFYEKLFKVIDGPATLFREKVVEPIRSKNKQYYYRRQFRRVPTIDECEIGDEVCLYEANEQYKRDRMVDSEVMKLLRARKVECMVYFGHTEYPKKCAKIIEDYEQATGMFHQKYGDMGAVPNVLEAYMKQKHRLIWERRHGPVGTGMKEAE